MERTSLTKEEITTLAAAATEAKQQSYSPYSKFRVGAALKTKDGKIFKGCNVENSSYGLSICAERTAFVKAVSEGYKDFTAIAVTTDVEKEFTSPCGACRQFMIEFGDMAVILAKPNGETKILQATELIPFGFTPKDLDLPRQ